MSVTKRRQGEPVPLTAALAAPGARGRGATLASRSRSSPACDAWRAVKATGRKYRANWGHVLHAARFVASASRVRRYGSCLVTCVPRYQSTICSPIQNTTSDRD
jgi:hypothetical protein